MSEHRGPNGEWPPTGLLLDEPPLAHEGQVVTWGPERARNERRWGVTLPDGSRAMVGQLLPELAGDPALRRRYVYEVQRLAALEAPCVAKILAHGPQPDPRDPAAPAPWRLRTEPSGRPLDRLLEARAPLPVEEALSLSADLADAVAQVHAAGAVLRDLEPRCIVVEDGSAGARVIRLIDVGLARLDILSSRTASSLMLESSPYAAPEHLRATVLDSRADVFSLGVILWQALTGALPFGDDAGILRDYSGLPSLAAVRPEVPEQAAALVASCLAEKPDQRPASARELADILRGKAAAGAIELAREPCQSCGQPLRPGMRLCLWCGKQAVQFRHVDGRATEHYVLYLTQAREDEAFLQTLRQLIAEIAEEMPALEFLIGDARMYSRQERQRLQAVPAPLFAELSMGTARALARRFEESGLKVQVRRGHVDVSGRRWGAALAAGGVGGVIAGVALAAGSAPLLGMALIAGSLFAGVWGVVKRFKSRGLSAKPMAELRAAPAALPASDPYIRRMAELLASARSPDVRERLSELALLLQRLSDHRAHLAPAFEGGARALIGEPLSRGHRSHRGRGHGHCSHRR